MHIARPYKIHKFSEAGPLFELPATKQQQYLLCYFSDLGAVSVLEEQNYFDRDYLAEFSAFYSISSQGYPNLCRRVLFFSTEINRGLIRRAANGSERSLTRLQAAYLGFVVIRPIPAAPLGRTVVRWYEDRLPPRVVSPSRKYEVHFAGITLTVEGLAWQQQDSAVGACATVGLWSMLHSSAFDDHHAIPTTAGITQAAHKRASLGARMFPSGGLNIYQICEAIKEQNLSPVPLEGDLNNNQGQIIGMSRERFSSSCAAFVRSGYPVLIIGHLGNLGQHAICAVGFRPAPGNNQATVELQDSRAEHMYIHDDNLGPNVRFRIDEESVPNEGELSVTRVVLRPSAPPPVNPRPTKDCPTDNYHDFRPTQLLVAVHNDLRTSPDQLHRAGLRHANTMAQLLNLIAQQSSVKPENLMVSTRFIKLADYLGDELGTTLALGNPVLGKVRLNLCEQVKPMSLHIGLVRIGKHDSSPLIDILYDTTDSDKHHPVYATVVYDPFVAKLVDTLKKAGVNDFGKLIPAF